MEFIRKHIHLKIHTHYILYGTECAVFFLLLHKHLDYTITQSYLNIKHTNWLFVLFVLFVHLGIFFDYNCFLSIPNSFFGAYANYVAGLVWVCDWIVLVSNWKSMTNEIVFYFLLLLRNEFHWILLWWHVTSFANFNSKSHKHTKHHSQRMHFHSIPFGLHWNQSLYILRVFFSFLFAQHTTTLFSFVCQIRQKKKKNSSPRALTHRISILFSFPLKPNDLLCSSSIHSHSPKWRSRPCELCAVSKHVHLLQ